MIFWEKEYPRLKEWIKSYLNNAHINKVVIGISGGKDSTTLAKVLADTIGPENVIGVQMPNGMQSDIKDSDEVFELTGIQKRIINIGTAVKSAYRELVEYYELDQMVTSNLPARMRMLTLYAVAAEEKALVVNTCNRSEDFIGWSTKFGDGAGDFAPFGLVTCSDVIGLGDYLKLPKHLIHKAPSDGMCGNTDEEKFGFSYATLDTYIDGTEYQRRNLPREIREKIERMYKMNRHKLLNIPRFEPEGIVLFKGEDIVVK